VAIHPLIPAIGGYTIPLIIDSYRQLMMQNYLKNQ
jgi:hypothetical protein